MSDVTTPLISLTDIPGAVVDSYGLPRVKLPVIMQRIPADADVDTRSTMWADAQRQWLHQLAAALNERYQVLESKHFLILTAYRSDAGWMCEFAEEARALILGLVGQE